MNSGFLFWPDPFAFRPLSDSEMFESWVAFGGDSTLDEYTMAYLACCGPAVSPEAPHA